MKKRGLYIIIGLVIVSQIFLIIKINGLKRDISNLNNSIVFLNSSISQEVGATYSNVEEMLNKQGSFIESSEIKLGSIDASNYTIPVTLTIIPREVSQETIMNLELEGEIIPMDRNGINFTATIDQDIFSSSSPVVILEDKGSKKITSNDLIDIENVKEKILPRLSTEFLGSTSYNNGICTRYGRLIISNMAEARDIKFIKFELISKVNDKIVSREDISEGIIGEEYDIKSNTPISIGEESILSLVATDSIGLEHHYIVDYWRDESPFPNREIYYGEELIYSSQGDLLWKPEYMDY